MDIRCLQQLYATVACNCCLHCASRQQIHEQDSRALELKAELVMLKESLDGTCLQRDVLHVDKRELGLYTLYDGRSVSNGNRCIGLKKFTFWKSVNRTFCTNTYELVVDVTSLCMYILLLYKL